jgi:hypothetical protein
MDVSEKTGKGKREDEETQTVFRSVLITLIIFGMVGLIVGLVIGLTKTIAEHHADDFPTVYSAGVNASQAVLFIGDSFTFYNDGINAHMKLLAASGTPSSILACDHATQGGSTLQRLWSLSFVRQSISIGHVRDQKMKYDYVVLQDDIPEYTSHTMDFFYDYVRMFTTEIRSSRSHAAAEPVLLMAWAYQRLPWVTLDQIATAHRTISDELGLLVAPVGLAFRRSLQARPSLAMLGGDSEHETLHGTYLAACTVLMTIEGQRLTTAFTYVPSGVSQEEGVFLRDIAKGAVLAWQSGSSTRKR